MTAKSGGKYRILAHLRGGDATESSLVAVESGEGGGLAVLKRLKLGSDTEPVIMECFKNEAILCKLFDHPNLAKLLEAGMDDGAPVLVFEYVEGVSLARLRSRAVREGGAMPKAIALRIVAGIAQGLAHLHGLTDQDGKPLQVVHRDVSPENVMVTYDGEVKLVEFGMATTVHTSAKSREDRVKGNVAYMAPEQAKADYKLDARADIFALGVILWELLTGKRFWDGVSEVDVLGKLGDDSPMPAPRTVVSALPEPLDKICSEAIHKVRDERTESVAQFLEQFKEVVKKTSLKATAEEVGEFVTSLFDDERTKMRAIVEQGRLEATSEEKKPLPAVGAPKASSPNPLIDKESDPRLRFGIATPDEEPPKRIIEVIVATTPPSADRRFGYMMAAAAIAVLGGITIYAVTHPGEEKKVEEKPYAPPVRPTATATATESAAEKEPEEVTIEVRVSTPQAKLYVDGVQVSNPYRTRVAPAKFPHAVRAEAEGFDTRTMSLTFDKERSVEMALTPAKKKP